MKKECLLALNQIESLSPTTIAKIEAHWPIAADFFALSHSDLCALGFGQPMAANIKKINFDQVDKALSWENRDTQHILDWHDTRYPKLLKQIATPPPVLFAHGNLDCLELSSIAIVGSRKASPGGINNAHQFSRELCQYNMSITSGLALGIDSHAHRGCLDVNGKTIAVLATGINRIYPARHHSLARNILQNGLILSEFPLDTPPLPRQFPRRNRIISGLSLGTLIVEASLNSGTLITANYALEQNREVFAIPGAINNPQASGCNHLLQQGAKLVTQVEDILTEFNINHQKKQSAVNILASSLDKCDKNLVECVGFEATPFDDIVKTSGLSANQLMNKLIELELSGIIKAVPGGYIRC